MSTTRAHIEDKNHTTLHSFRLILEGRVLNDDVVEALVRGGCADGFFGSEQGLQTADFDREAGTFEEAVLSAIRDVEASVDGLYVVRVAPDDLVTASAIAERTGRTRQNIAQLVAGQRGPGGFPAPLSNEHVRVWRWSDVSHWLADRNPNGEQLFDHRQSHYIAALNGALQARQHLRAYSSHGGLPECAGVVEHLLDRQSNSAARCSLDRSYPIRKPQSSPTVGLGAR